MDFRKTSIDRPAVSMSSIKAGIAYFAIVFGAGFVLGVIRVPLVAPRLGERYAELAEMPIMLLAIILAARCIVTRFELAPTLAVRLKAGLMALALLVSAELLLATLLQHQSVSEYIASRDPVSGSVYAAMLVVFALMPALLLLHARLRDTRDRH